MYLNRLAIVKRFSNLLRKPLHNYVPVLYFGVRQLSEFNFDAQIQKLQYYQVDDFEELKGNIAQLKRAFQKMDTKNQGYITMYELSQYLQERGLYLENHPLLVQQVKKLFHNGSSVITWDNFAKTILQEERTVLHRAFCGKLAIPNWKNFCQSLQKIFNEVKENRDGEVATYIPELGKQDPEWFGVSVVSVDGQQFELGDSKQLFPIESCVKPIIYTKAVEELGYDYVHKFVGKEPSGAKFNALLLDNDQKPHNACINAGSIAICGLLHAHDSANVNYSKIVNALQEYSGGLPIDLNQEVYLSEKKTGNRNYSLAYFMASQGTFPQESPVQDTVDFYFKMCSLNVSCQHLATTAAMYANRGRSPTTGKKLLRYDIVKQTLQLLYTYGMYDYTGEWNSKCGAPAKSGKYKQKYLLYRSFRRSVSRSTKYFRNVYFQSQIG